MRKQGFILLIIGIIGLLTIIINAVLGNYRYERDYLSYWNLAEKASTIPQKKIYIEKFAVAIQSAGLQGDYDAILLKTPDNSFDKNFEALLSLRNRLEEIQKMNVSSFEYQTAIQQITQQEQGEASKLLETLEGVWLKNNYIIIWDWVCGLLVFSCLSSIIIGLIKISGGFKKVGKMMSESSQKGKM